MITNGNKMIIDEVVATASSETTTTDQITIQKQREYIKLLESELQSLKEHFQSSMEKIMSSPLFSQSVLLSVSSSSSSASPSALSITTPTTLPSNQQQEVSPTTSQSNLSNNVTSTSSATTSLSTTSITTPSKNQIDEKASSKQTTSDNKAVVQSEPTPTTTTPSTSNTTTRKTRSSQSNNNNTKQQASTTTPTKKRKIQEEEEEESSSSDSEDDDDEDEEEESTEEESPARKTRQQARKRASVNTYDSEEEVIENIFDMKFWNKEIAKWKTIDAKTLPKVKTPKEGTKQPLDELEKILEKQLETTPTKSKAKSKRTKEAQSSTTFINNNSNASSSTSSSNGASNSNVIDISSYDKEPYLFDLDDKEPIPLTEPIIQAIGTRTATKVEVFKKLWEYLHEKELLNETHRIVMDPLIKSVLGLESDDVITINEFNRHVIEQLRQAFINKQRKEDISQKFIILE